MIVIQQNLKSFFSFSIICFFVLLLSNASKAQTFTSFMPSSATTGATVTITGTGFGTTGSPAITAVSFGGVNANSFSVTNSTTMTAVVGAGASGSIVLTKSAGGTVSHIGFTYTAPSAPTISSFTPTAAGAGTTVTITGTNFSVSNISVVSAVSFNGTAASSFNVVSSTSITAVVATGSSSGNVSVTTTGGNANKSGFTFVPAPTVTSFTPTSAAAGQTVTITGTNFSGTGVTVNSVKFGGTAATSFNVVSSTSITAVVASGSSGSISVNTTGGNGSDNGFSYIAAPTITTFTYNGSSGLSTFTAPAGATVTINGTNFGSSGNPFITAVTFGGTAAASFNVTSSTVLTATIGTGTTGNVVVTNAAGSATKTSAFTFIPTPTITNYTYNGTTSTSFTAPSGASVVINGTNFSGTNLGTSTVTIGGVSATVTNTTSTAITATIGANANVNSNVAVTNSGGTATLGGFTYIPTPTITNYTYNGTTSTSFTAPSGASVVINGTNFSGTNIGTSTVTIGGVSATVTNTTSTAITATIGANANVNSNVVITNNGGTATLGGFTYIPTPTITNYTYNGTTSTSFTAASGASVTINGTNFTGTNIGTSTVTIGGVSATVTNTNSTSITATIGANASINSNVTVTNNGGTATLGGFTYIPTPTITNYTYNGTTSTSFTAPSGASVVINGTNFSGTNLGTSTVTIGGVSAAVTNTTSIAITATVGANANVNSNATVTNNGGTATLGGFTYIAAPTIISFSPTSSGAGNTVTITGTNFSGTGVTVSSVSFGGTNASSFNVVNSTTITAVVASGTSGNVSVTTTGGTASLSGFTFLVLPVITSTSSSAVFAGDVITITGTDLSGATAVTFGGVDATSYTVVSSTSITVTVPTGVSGTALSLTVTTAAGTSSGNTISINSKWTGSSTSDWNDANSWSSLVVPGSEDVTIPSGLGTYPVLSSGVTVGNLILNGTVSLNDQLLEVSTSVTGSGNFISTSNSSLDMEGSGTINFDPSNNNLGTLTINSTVSLGNALNIYGILYPISGTFNTNGYLTFKNTSIAQSGVVASVGATISGNVTVERYIPQNTSYRAFRDLCPMVANAGSVFNNWQEGGNNSNGYGVQITGIKGVYPGVDPVKGFDITPAGNGSMETYSSAGFAYATNTKTMMLDPAQGYRLLIRGNRSYSLFTTPQPTGMNSDATLRATGNLVTGTVTYNTSGTSSTGGYSSSYGLNTGTGTYSFIGNPYLSTVSWTDVAANSAGIQPYYYYLDPTFTDGSGNLTYVTFNSVSGTNDNSNSNVGDDIQPGQAIFVLQDGSGTSPQVVFQESSKTTGNSPTEIFGTPTQVNKISMQLWKKNKSIDGAALVFKTGFTEAIGKEDSRKILNVGENLTIFQSGIPLCIDGIGLPDITDTVALQLMKMDTNTVYQLKLNATMFDGNGMNAYLKDAFLNTQTLVTADSTIINFNTTKDSSSYFHRFSIVFSPSSPLPVNGINLSAVFKSGNTVDVNWSFIGENNVAKYTLQHSTNSSRDFSDVETVKEAGVKDYSYVDTKASEGFNYYRIKVLGNNGEVVYSPTVKVLVGKLSDNNMIVYPNPVEGKSFSLKLDSLSSGNYTVQIYNNLGESVLSKSIVHSGGVLLDKIETSTLAAGIYTVKLIGDNGGIHTNQILVQKQ